MRDPARIRRILDKLEELWIQVPDQRFCQFLYNLNFVFGISLEFYKEDDVLEKNIDEALDKLAGL